MIIPLGEWRPDLPALDNPGALEARNCVPLAPGVYGPWRAQEAYSNALTARCRGVGSGITPAGDVEVFAGDATRLYKLGGGAFTDVSGTAYATTAEERWQFAAYGPKLIATNHADLPQVWQLGTSSRWADLTPSGTSAQKAPRARHVTVVGSFVVFGNVVDADGTLPNRLRWSPINDPAGDWSDSTTQASSRDLYTGGEIMGLVGGEVGTVLCRSAIYRLAYLGRTPYFQTDEIIPNKGCIASGSVANFGRLTFFLSEDGFYIFDGERLNPIGSQKVDDWFATHANPDVTRMTSAIDPTRKLYVVSFRCDTDDPDTLLIYNWEVGFWSRVETGHQMIGSYFTPGMTLEELDTISTSIDALPDSLDSRRWQGGAYTLGCFDVSNRLAGFTGAALPATIDTPELRPSPGRSFWREATPLVDGAATIALAGRDTQIDAVTFGMARSPRRDTGAAALDTDARFGRLRLALTGEWSRAQGIDAELLGSSHG